MTDNFDQKEFELLVSQANIMARKFEIGVAQGLYLWDKDSIESFKATSLEDLICDEYFLGLKNIIRPSLLEDIFDLWEEKKKREIHLACFEEGIGCGKSLKSSIILWLQWFELCLHENPQRYFGIESNSRITFVCSSRTEMQARRIAYSKVYARFLSPFNKDYFPPNPGFKNEIQILRNNTFIYAGNGSALSVQGFDYYGGIMDESNSMERIEESKRGTLENTVYDAAEELESEISNRMTSRFLNKAGMLVAISSHTHKEDFLRRKEKEYLRLGNESKIYFKRRMYCESFYLSSKAPFDKYNKNCMDPDTGRGKFDDNEGFYYINVDTIKEVSKEVADMYFYFMDILSQIIKDVLDRYNFTLKEYEILVKLKESERT